VNQFKNNLDVAENGQLNKDTHFK